MLANRWGVILLAAYSAGCVPGEKAVRVKGFDSAAIEQAMAAAKPGATVQLPAGTFTLTQAIQPKSGTRLIGAGQESTILRYAGEKPGVFISLRDCQDVEVAGLTLDGENNPNVHQGIAGGNSSRLRIHHVTIRNLVKSQTFGPHGILFSGVNPTRQKGVTDSQVSDCVIEDVGLEAKFGCGIRFAWGSSRNLIQRNVIRNTGRGGIFGDNGSTDLVIRGNIVMGSGGEGLGIEVWKDCDRAVIEDNIIDHWLSIGGSNFCAVRRNVVAAPEGKTKSYGLETIGNHLVVTDNVVDRTQGIGISVSDKMVKNHHLYAYNTIRHCYHWGAQLQGEAGGISAHYFYRCKFLETQAGHPAVKYKGAEGNGFRTNGNVKHVVFEECDFSDNARYGLQLGGPAVDSLSFVRCAIRGNKTGAVIGPRDYTALEWKDCVVEGNGNNDLTPAKAFSSPPPIAGFQTPVGAAAGEAVTFSNTSVATKGKIVGALWDFGDGSPTAEMNGSHVYERPAEYRVTLVVWDDAGRGARTERRVQIAQRK